MKRPITIFLMTILALRVQCQEIKFLYDYDKSDIRDAFTLLGVSNFKYQMPSEFRGCYFDLIIKEYYEGKEISSVSQAKKLISSRQVLLWKKETEEYILKIQSAKLNDTVETFNARMPGIGLRGRKLILKLPRHEYGWETLINDSTKLILDTEIPILTFASDPSNESRPNIAVYCELSGSAQEYKYKDWYDKFKVKHYFVLLVKVNKN